MAKKQDMTKADMIREFLKKKPEGTSTECGEKYGVEISSSQFSTIRAQMAETAKSEAKQKSATKKKSPDQNRILKLERRIKYLEWVRIGEREGFVDDLLREFEEEAT